MRYSQIKLNATELRKNQTDAEKFFWLLVRNRKFYGYKFNRQFIVEYENSSYFIVDFYCHSKRLIVEIDGKIHLQQIEEDRSSDAILKELGYKVLRFSNTEVLKRWQSVEIRMLGELTPNLESSNRSLTKRGE